MAEASQGEVLPVESKADVAPFAIITVTEKQTGIQGDVNFEVGFSHGGYNPEHFAHRVVSYLADLCLTQSTPTDGATADKMAELLGPAQQQGSGLILPDHLKG